MGPTEVSITNKLQKMEERNSGVADTIEEIDSSVKEKVKSQQILITKHPGNLGHHEKNNPKNNRDRRRRRTPAQRHKKYIFNEIFEENCWDRLESWPPAALPC